MDIFELSIADKNPPTKERLAYLEKSLDNKSKLLYRAKSILQFLYYFLISISIIANISLYVYSVTNGQQLTSMFLTVGILLLGTYNLQQHLLSLLFPFFLAGLGLSFIVDSHLSITSPIFTIIALALILIAYTRSQVEINIENTKTETDKFIILNHENYHDEYHYFLSNYYSNIAKESRYPVAGEYLAAKKWIDKFRNVL